MTDLQEHMEEVELIKDTAYQLISYQGSEKDAHKLGRVLKKADRLIKYIGYQQKKEEVQKSRQLHAQIQKQLDYLQQLCIDYETVFHQKKQEISLHTEQENKVSQTLQLLPNLLMSIKKLYLLSVNDVIQQRKIERFKELQNQLTSIKDRNQHYAEENKKSHKEYLQIIEECNKKLHQQNYSLGKIVESTKFTGERLSAKISNLKEEQGILNEKCKQITEKYLNLCESHSNGPQKQSEEKQQMRSTPIQCKSNLKQEEQWRSSAPPVQCKSLKIPASRSFYVKASLLVVLALMILIQLIV